MRPFETMIASDGKEVALFHMPYLYMSQDEGGDYSHLNTYNIDFLGYDGNERIYNAPIYAPCTMKVVFTNLSYSGGNMVVFESVNPVHLADGTIDYLTIMFAHDPSPPYTTLNQVVRQGQICYHTGQYGNVTGDHVHTCVGKGNYEGFTERDGGHTDLTNRIHYWNGLYVNNTDILRGFNHSWVDYNGSYRVFGKSNKFKWVLYSRNLRRRIER